MPHTTKKQTSPNATQCNKTNIWVLFDWDNTLVDSFSTIYNAYIYCFNAMQKDLPWAADITNDITHNHTIAKLYVQHSLHDIFPKFFGEAWPLARQYYYEYYTQNHTKNLCVMPGATALLDTLSQYCYIGIISNKKGDLLRKEIQYLDWHDRFIFAIGAGDAPHDKPHKACFEHCLTYINAHTYSPPIYYIGDSPIDAQFADNAHINPIMVHEYHDTINAPYAPTLGHLLENHTKYIKKLVF